MLLTKAIHSVDLFVRLEVPELKAELQKRGLNTVGTRKESRQLDTRCPNTA